MIITSHTISASELESILSERCASCEESSCQQLGIPLHLCCRCFYEAKASFCSICHEKVESIRR